LVTGHRGAGFLEPENTLRSINRAIELGVDQIEIDVHLSKDERVVVIHDTTVDRTTNGHGYVSDFSLAEIKGLDAGEGECIPILEEVIELTKGRVILQIELKGLDVEKETVKIVEKKDVLDGVILTSFRHRAVKNVKMLNPKIETGILFVCRPVDVVQLATSAHADAIHPNINYVDKEMVYQARMHNLKVRVWNADDEKTLSKMISLGVDAIGTNRPDILLRMLKRY
jgi:glycerophosphoryl diester phosphodiesterase